MWAGDNYPQEYIVDTVDPNDLEPITEYGLPEPIAARLNALLSIVQQQQEQIERLRRHDPWKNAPD